MSVTYLKEDKEHCNKTFVQKWRAQQKFNSPRDPIMLFSSKFRLLLVYCKALNFSKVCYQNSKSCHPDLPSWELAKIKMALSMAKGGGKEKGGRCRKNREGQQRVQKAVILFSLLPWRDKDNKRCSKPHSISHLLFPYHICGSSNWLAFLGLRHEQRR